LNAVVEAVSGFAIVCFFVFLFTAKRDVRYFWAC